MGAEQSILKQKGYKLVTETSKKLQNSVVVTKNDEEFFVQKISLQKYRDAHQELTSEIEILKDKEDIRHPHIVSYKDSFEDQNTYYVVMEYCKGGSLAEKIKGMSQPPQESEALSWFVEICVAMKTIHEKGLLHKHLIPENVLFTEFGTVRLGNFGKIYENSKNTGSNANLNESETMHFLAPEGFTEGTYNAKSDIWSMGCLLYELCTQKPAFSAETPVKLIAKIIGGPYPELPNEYSPELRELLDDIFRKDPELRPTASKILEYPVIIHCLLEKCKTTVEELQTKVDNLRKVADGLESVHQGATVGSLAGGVVGLVGGVTSIVGLILTPFTLGASLIVTGVGIGVGALGGVAAGASNIAKMVNQSSDRKAVRGIIEEIEEKIGAVVTWLKEISNSLQTIENRFDPANTPEGQNKNLNKDKDNPPNFDFRVGRGLAGIPELVRLLQVTNIGKIVAQTARVVRIAEAATGVLAGLFVAVDIFFIAMDAKEIHHIRQAKAAEDRGQSSSKEKPEIRSEIMKFVLSIREAADNLQGVLDELKSFTSSIPSLQNTGTELEQRS